MFKLKLRHLKNMYLLIHLEIKINALYAYINNIFLQTLFSKTN